MKIRLHTIIAVLLLITAGTLLSGCSVRFSSSGWNTNFLKKEEAKEYILKKTQVEPISSIEISTRIADVELIEADDYYVEIDYLYWLAEPEYSLKNGKLSFNDNRIMPNSYSINFSINNVIRIYLPEAAALEKLNIKSASGDVSAASFAADDMNIDVAYGDLTVKKASAGDADITLASGNSRISEFQVSRLSFTNSYGEAFFGRINSDPSLLPEGRTCDSIDITMSSGDIDMEELTVKSLEIKNSYGDITCEKINAEIFDMELSSGNLEVSDSDLADTDIDSSYGNVSLRLKGEAKDYSLDIDTSYGNITVDGKKYDGPVNINSNGSRSLNADLNSGDIRISFD